MVSFALRMPLLISGSKYFKSGMNIKEVDGGA